MSVQILFFPRLSYRFDATHLYYDTEIKGSSGAYYIKMLLFILQKRKQNLGLFALKKK